MSGEPRDASAVEQRRLAAIVFTDVVSYSARMGRDEAGTMALVRADFATMQARCLAHHGEVLNTMGDGMLMCFPSAVEAVACALELQKAFGLRAAAEPPAKALQHRVGIHVGDVFWQGGQVSGDGVNIAARLEGKAPHGGICVSQFVYDTVKGKIEMASVFLGEQKFKNIAEPLAVYTIAPPGSVLENQPSAPEKQQVTLGLRWRLVAVVAVLVLGGYFAWRHNPTATGPTAASQAAAGSANPAATSPGRKLAEQAQALCRKPSFTRDDLALAGEFTRKACELEPDLAFAWSTRAEVGASYVLRGWDSDQRWIRDAESWAKRAQALDPKESGALFALGTIAQAQQAYAQAERWLQQAVAASPDYSRFRLTLAQVLYDAGRVEQARAMIQEAIVRHPRDQLPHYNLALTYVRYSNDGGATPGNRTAAVRELDAALALGPMSTALLLKAAIIGGWEGDVKRMRESLDRLGPEERTDDRAVHLAMWCGLLGRNPEEVQSAAALSAQDFIEDVESPKAWFVALAHNLAGRDALARTQWQSAETMLRERLQRNPGNRRDRLSLATTLSWLGRSDEVAREIEPLEASMREQKNPWWDCGLARLYAGQGDATRALPYLRRVLNQMIFVTAKTVPLDPWWDKLRGKPEFEALLAELGAPPSVMKAPAAAPVATAPKPASAPAESSSAKASPPNEKSVAVLAFANMSDEKENEYFSDGISEELLNVLAKIPGLKVSARTSAFYFKGKDTPIPEIARKLGVAYVVEGSVRKAGDKVRITAQLIKATDDFHVWSDTFTRDLKDIFAVQDEIAGLIAQNLKIKLGAVQRTTRVVNPEAHRLVLEGRYYWNKRDGASLQRGEEAFSQAIQLDPGYAEAYSGLAGVCAIRELIRQSNGFAPNPAETARVRAMAQRAIELDPTMAEPHGTLGFSLQQQHGHLQEAKVELEKALALDPRDPVVHGWHGLNLLLQGRMEDAVSHWEKTIAVDPLYVINLSSYPRTLGYLGRYEEALKVYDRVAALSPGYSIPISGVRAQLLWKLGRKEEALAEARAIRNHREPAQRLTGDASAIYVLREAGFADEAAEFGEEALQRFPANIYLRGMVLGALGRFDEALPFLERTPVASTQILYWESMWDPWRDEPRFGELMEKLRCAGEYKFARETLARVFENQPAKLPPPKKVPAVAPADKSVAVLAFANMSDDKENEYFSDGISEELLNVLAKIPGLRVSARTSAFYFKGRDTPIPEIARKLGVAYVVEGSVRKAGDKVRITAQLIRAADDSHLWSETFTRDLKDIFAVQDEIAGLIAQNLQIKLGTAKRAPRVVNPEAHRLVLEGRFYWNQRNDAGFARSEEAFDRAIQLDPNYAEAYSGLAGMCAVRELFRQAAGLGPNLAETARVRAMAQRAIELDPTMAEPHASLGYSLQQQHGHLQEAKVELEKALTLNPGDPIVHAWYALNLLLQGRLDEAMSQWEKALELDPLFVVNLPSYVRGLTYVGRWEDALKVQDRVTGLNPAISIPNSGQRARMLWALRRKDEAIAEARFVRSHGELTLRWDGDSAAIYVLREAGLADEGAAFADEALKRFPEGSHLHGFVLAALGRFDEALPFLERTPVAPTQMLYYDSMWDLWREDPRFASLLEKLSCSAEYKVGRATLARMLRERGPAR